jgi:cation transport protein ChaC
MTPNPQPLTDDQTNQNWVFGYGSLMWRPDFPYAEQCTATLDGFHRAFCIYSHRYRGTPDQPGLVLGLDTGGRCIGTGFRVKDADWDAVVDYLNERELIGYAYKPKTLPISVEGNTLQAYTFIADRTHGHYAGDLTIEHSADIIMRASGIMGLNRDYLINTVRELEVHGFADKDLHALLDRVNYLTGIIDQGGGI